MAKDVCGLGYPVWKRTIAAMAGIRAHPAAAGALGEGEGGRWRRVPAPKRGGSRACATAARNRGHHRAFRGSVTSWGGKWGP